MRRLSLGQVQDERLLDRHHGIGGPRRQQAWPSRSGRSPRIEPAGEAPQRRVATGDADGQAAAARVHRESGGMGALADRRASRSAQAGVALAVREAEALAAPGSTARRLGAYAN